MSTRESEFRLFILLQHNPIKRVATIKTKRNTKINHLLPDNDLKRQKQVLEKTK